MLPPGSHWQQHCKDPHPETSQGRLYSRAPARAIPHRCQSTQDGHLRVLRIRAASPLPRRPPSEGLRRQDIYEGEDWTNCGE